MSARAQALEAALRELTAMVRGECPSLLNEDSGGCARLSIEIDALLAAPPVGVSPQPDEYRERMRLHDLVLEVLAAWQESENEDDIVKRSRTRTAFRDRLKSPASLSPVEPTPPQEFIDIEPEIRVVRIYRNGSWLEDIKAGGRRHASFPAVEPTPEPPTHERCHDLVCNASRDHHRGAKGVGCSCAGRDAAYQELAALKPTGAPAPCVWQLNAGNRYSTTCGRSYSNLPWEVAEWSVCPHCTAPLTVER